MSFPDTPMPAFSAGDALDERERDIFVRVATLIHEVEPLIPLDSVQPQLTLWDIGFESLRLTSLRQAIETAFGAGSEPIRWLRLHRQRPYVGCLARFLASGAAAGARSGARQPPDASP